MIILPGRSVSSRLNYTLKMYDGTFLRKCRICGMPSFQFPIQIVGDDNTTLCAEHSEKYTPVFHFEINTYLDKNPLRLKKIQVDSNRQYTLLFKFANDDDFEVYIEQMESFLLSIIGDEFNVSSFYCITKNYDEVISGFQFKSEFDDNVDKSLYIRNKTRQLIIPEIIDCLLLIESDKFYYDNKEQFSINSSNHCN